jgi:hypothetical protein
MVYIRVCNLVSYLASDGAVGNLKAVKSVTSAYREPTGQNIFSTFTPH